MDSVSFTPGLIALVAVVLVAGALVGAALALLGMWVWYTVRLVSRIERRGELYLSDWDNAQAANLKLAYELSTSMEFHRKALRMLDPEMAKEFTRDVPPEKSKKGKGKK